MGETGAPRTLGALENIAGAPQWLLSALWIALLPIALGAIVATQTGVDLVVLLLAVGVIFGSYAAFSAIMLRHLILEAASRRRFGKAFLHLPAGPPVAGREWRGEIEPGPALAETAPSSAALRCFAVTWHTGKSIWLVLGARGVQRTSPVSELPVAANRRPNGRLAVAVTVPRGSPPADPPEHTELFGPGGKSPQGQTFHRWILGVSWRIRGQEVTRTFLVPVTASAGATPSVSGGR